MAEHSPPLFDIGANLIDKQLINNFDDIILESKKNDVNGMVNAIRSIIENKSLASKLSTNARKKAQTFSWHNVKKSWKKLLL